jgi:hypothetical protein
MVGKALGGQRRGTHLGDVIGGREHSKLAGGGGGLGGGGCGAAHHPAARLLLLGAADKGDAPCRKQQHTHTRRSRGYASLFSPPARSCACSASTAPPAALPAAAAAAGLPPGAGCGLGPASWAQHSTQPAPRLRIRRQHVLPTPPRLDPLTCPVGGCPEGHPGARQAAGEGDLLLHDSADGIESARGR